MRRQLTGLAARAASLVRKVATPVTVGVRGIVIDPEDGRVAFVRHTYVVGWFLPGGGVNKGEALEDAVIRELDEEIGVSVTAPPEVFGAYTNFAEGRTDHVVVYTVRAWTRRPRRSAEIAEVVFAPPDAPPAGTSAGTLRRLSEFRELSVRTPRW